MCRPGFSRLTTHMLVVHLSGTTHKSLIPMIAESISAGHAGKCVQPQRPPAAVSPMRNARWSTIQCLGGLAGTDFLSSLQTLNETVETMIRKLLLPILSIAGMAMATEVTTSGVLSADVGSYFKSDFVPANTANHDITLTTHVAFNEKTSVDVSLTATSSVKDPTDSTKAVASVIRAVEPGRNGSMTDVDSRWPAVAFDGIQFQWEFARKVKLLVGDLSYNAGTTNYYGYRWTQVYSSIFKETSLRGVGFQLGDEGQVYLGAPDANNRALWGFAGYAYPVIKRTDEKLVVRPVGDLVFRNGGRERRYTLGTELQYSKASGDLNYGMNGAAAILPTGNHYSYTLLGEPSFGYKKFSLGGTFYQAFLPNREIKPGVATDIPEERFAYVEPGFQVLPKFSIGLGGEYHDPMLNLKDEWFGAVPTFYLYPSEEMSFTFWTRYRWMIAAADDFALGIDAEVKF